MKLFLIRHGETVDNVAGLYAGTLDSALTNHGFEQANRLGTSFAEHDVKFSHIFASPLSRASKTAGAIQKAQSTFTKVEGCDFEIVKVSELIERDYGVYEGKPYASRSEWMKTGADGHEDSSGGVEDVTSLARRGDKFLDEHLLPLFDEAGNGEYIVAVVAHGMLLSHLWRRLLLRLPRKTLTIAPEIIATRDNIILEHLGGWSNTGYLELSIRKQNEDERSSATARDVSSDSAAPDGAPTSPTPTPPPLQAEGADVSVAPPKRGEIAAAKQRSPRTLAGWSTTILAIDSKQHLVGLKRQPGGIGSLAHDEGQKKLDSFFKRQKLS